MEINIEQENELLVEYILSLAGYISNAYPEVDIKDKINKALNIYENTNIPLDQARAELVSKANEIIEEAQKNREFDKVLPNGLIRLNEIFSYGIRGNLLHLHVIPKSLKEDIERVGIKNFLKYITEKLNDAFEKIESLLIDNSYITKVGACSPLLKVKVVQEMFTKYGFSVQETTDPNLLNNFPEKKVYEVEIESQKFLNTMLNKNNDFQMLEKINYILSSDYLKAKLQECFKKTNSMEAVSKLVGEVFTYHFLHRDGINFEEYFNNIFHLYTNPHPEEMIENMRSRLIAKSIMQKLGIEFDENYVPTPDEHTQVKQYFLNNYVKNGYVLHSFSNAFLEEIKGNGLSSDKRIWNDEEIMEIANIFVQKNVPNALGGYKKYNGKGIYYTHDTRDIFMHALYSPEWFNFFTSSNHQNNSQLLSESPFLVRNYNSCRQNVVDLCENCSLEEAQTEKVLNFFESKWNTLMVPQTSVALIPKRIVQKNIIDEQITKDPDALSVIRNVMNDENNRYMEHVGNRHLKDIKGQILFSPLPNQLEIFENVAFTRETKAQLYSKPANITNSSLNKPENTQKLSK